jgi:hypothetical protein
MSSLVSTSHHKAAGSFTACSHFRIPSLTKHSPSPYPIPPSNQATRPVPVLPYQRASNRFSSSSSSPLSPPWPWAWRSRGGEPQGGPREPRLPGRFSFTEPSWEPCVEPSHPCPLRGGRTFTLTMVLGCGESLSGFFGRDDENGNPMAS